MQRETHAPRSLSVSAVRRGFERAAARFDTADPVHAYARQRLLERLELLSEAPATILDLGCATGKATVELAKRYPEARIAGVDLSCAMLAEARKSTADEPRITLLAGDAERLPFAAGAVELIFANMLLPWCLPQAVFAEVRRVLATDGVIVFATAGPDTLRELKNAWAEVDRSVHVHEFLDMHDIGDLALAAGLREPVIDVDRVSVTYPSIAALLAELGASGARNADLRRRRTLTGTERWRRFEAALASTASGARLAVSVELVFGQARGAGARTREAADEVAIPIESLRRRGPVS